MIKRAFFTLCLFCFFNLAAAWPGTLTDIRSASYPEKLRVVLDFDGVFSYTTDEDRQQITLFLKDTQAGSYIKDVMETGDAIVPRLNVKREDPDLKVTIPLFEPLEYYVFYLNDPPRLVIDFNRQFTSVASNGQISDGVEYLTFAKSLDSGQLTAHILKVDLNKNTVYPALAKKQKPNFLDSLISLVTPWLYEKDSDHFYLDKVLNIVSQHKAIAGVNGTYFASSGSPLGALIINKELVSFPINDRTALFFDENNQPYIDNIFVESYFLLPDNTRYEITGLNRGRSANDAILYSSAWGRSTGTNQSGLELSIVNDRVRSINVSNSTIPDEGFVLSVTGPALETLAGNIKVGDKLKTVIKIIPFSTSPNSVINLISGGPRLVKKGTAYVSKYEESFQPDIARGRAARTALGITKDNQLLLVAVDGRSRRAGLVNQEENVGATLEELADILLALGAQDAVNLDGGSSTTMVIGGRTVNAPTAGFQRRVSNALLIQSRN